MSFASLDALKAQLATSPDTIEFADVIALIDAEFVFTPSAFSNGEVNNEVGQNNGSCKLLALGQYLELDKDQTLALFGRFYREDVLGNPGGSDHANIRNFMQSGQAGVAFAQFPLVAKA
ncbi:MAG: HopJ type III effector protein [Pseudomonadota bacterium]|uniref:HopJ type III effector protein n=1 Tax=Gallaecimonas pentaromativorans TaxID=584787 RepID=UPI00067F652B|nr:HopJ type III effector protein [Gallaecimonas pentaromativorans]MED5525690.1 HopJ type III effector protein [Pseudomonadota bacterium]